MALCVGGPPSLILLCLWLTGPHCEGTVRCGGRPEAEGGGEAQSAGAGLDRRGHSQMEPGVLESTNGTPSKKLALHPAPEPKSLNRHLCHEGKLLKERKINLANMTFAPSELKSFPVCIPITTL